MQRCQRVLDLFRAWDERRDAIPVDDLLTRLRELELGREDLAGALVFGKRTYRRVAIWRRSHYEALVLCWRSGQASLIHDHRGSACVVKVVEGCATETRYSRSPCGRLVPLKSESFPAGSVTRCEDADIHQMANLEPPGHDLISLHVYSPPPRDWRTYPIKETTLGNHDRLLRKGPKTLLVDFGHVTPVRAHVRKKALGPRREAEESRPLIAIVGAGFSGAMVAVHLARLAGPGRLGIVCYEKTDRLARGLAYSTACDQHLLNVPAGSMSALPDEPRHFLDWLLARDPSAHARTFAPRCLYGDYLKEILTTTARDSGTRIEFERDEVIDLDEIEGSARVRLTTLGGARRAADHVVLALGNAPPEALEGLDPAAAGDDYVADPWSTRPLDGLDADDPIVLVGTGLTAVDVVVEAHARGHRGAIYAISRHGLLPCAHRVPPVPALQQIRIMNGATPTARSLLKNLRFEVAHCQQCGNDWRSVVDGLRPFTQTIWRSLGDGERARFMRHLAPRWDVHRHRVAPQINDLIRAAAVGGRLVVIAGRIVELARRDGMIEVSFRRRGTLVAETLAVRRVINCTGPARDVRVGPSQLIRSIIARGVGRPGPLALGLDVTDSGALIRQDGRPHERIFAIGPLLKERLWETTAVPELRVQTRELARILLAQARGARSLCDARPLVVLT
jgi:uncharacterized NAD(P)/FAD-binding protein YdhS